MGFNHIVVIVAGKLGTQAVGGLGRFAVADRVRDDDVVLGCVDPLFRVDATPIRRAPGIPIGSSPRSPLKGRCSRLGLSKAGQIADDGSAILKAEGRVGCLYRETID